MILNSVIGTVSSSQQEPSAISARYWRIFCEACSNGSYYSTVDVEMRASVGGADQTTIGQAISGSEFSGSYLDDYAFNGNTSNYWLCAVSAGADAWVGQDFTTDTVVAEVTIKSRTHASNFDQTPSQFKIQYSSDAVTWTDALAVTGQSWASNETKTYEI